MWNVHGKVEGTSDGGVAYRARDPKLLLWVHATLVDTSLLVYDRYVARLTIAERERYYEEQKAMGEAFGVPLSEQPETFADFNDYFATVVEDELAVTDVVRDVLDSIQNPELPGGAVTRGLAWPLFEPVRMATAGMLPERLRRELGLSGAAARGAGCWAPRRGCCAPPCRWSPGSCGSSRGHARRSAAPALRSLHGVNILGVPIDLPTRVVGRALSDLGDLARVAREMPARLDDLQRRLDRALEVAETIDRRMEPRWRSASAWMPMRPPCSSWGSSCWRWERVANEQAVLITESAREVAVRGAEVAATLPTLERAVALATPLEGTVERLGRIVDRLPGSRAAKPADD